MDSFILLGGILSIFEAMIKIPLTKLTLQEEGVHLILTVIICDQSYKMVLDTGASKTVFDKHSLMEIPSLAPLLESSTTLSSGLGTNSMESYTLKLPELKMETWVCRHTTFAVLDLTSINYAYEQMHFEPVIGVLGGDILAQYEAKIDYKKMYLSLRKTKSQK